VGHRAANFEEAEAWDLDFWQRQSPEQRLSAFVAIRRDVDKVMKARLSKKKAERKDR
jgi:predicted RNA-binding Zn ribbon-like protein